MCYKCGSNNDPVYRVRNNDQDIIGCCIVDEGYYCIWDRTHMALQCEDWVELCDFRNVMRQISHITFNVVSQRQKARTALNNIKRAAPFEECTRFPWRKVYVNISCSLYATVLQNILGSLDFKERETEKEMKYGRNGKQDDEGQTARSEYTMDDSKTQFRNSLKDLENELCKLNEVYDRKTFESKYGLTWCKGPCPVEPPYKPPERPPNVPEFDRYGYMMDRLKEMGFEPTDFSVFTEGDIRNPKFECDREIQQLGPTLSRNKFPSGTENVYIFTSGEYSQCSEREAVMGFIYSVSSGKIIGKVNLKEPRLFIGEMEECGFCFELSDYSWGLFRSAVRRSKYPNSRLPSREKLNRLSTCLDSSGDFVGSSSDSGEVVECENGNENL